MIDIFLDYIVRDAFNGDHKSIVILDTNQIEIGRISVGEGLVPSVEDYIRDIIIQNYAQESILGGH